MEGEKHISSVVRRWVHFAHIWSQMYVNDRTVAIHLCMEVENLMWLRPFGHILNSNPVFSLNNIYSSQGAHEKLAWFIPGSTGRIACVNSDSC
jgi:hypothetical protein